MAFAQDAPTAPVPATQTPSQPVHHRHHHAHSRRTNLAPPAPVPTPSTQASNTGMSPAPVPNEDVGPPQARQGTDASVTPGSMAIHYPPTGDGYLPGSSPEDMDNEVTPKVPGVQMKLPLQDAAPQSLPPPDTGR